MTSEFLERLRVLRGNHVDDSLDIYNAHVDFPCAHCESNLTHMVAEIEGISYVLFCSHCMKPTVGWVDDKGEQQISPTKQPSKAPTGTPDNVEVAWFESERCFYAGAYKSFSW